MKPVLLVSTDESLKESLESGLPPFLAAAGIQRVNALPLAFSGADHLQEASLILLDLRQAEEDSPTAAALPALFTGEPADTRPPILAILAHAAQRTQAFAAGADDFIFFPLQPEELRARFALLQPRRFQQQDDRLEQMAVVGRLAGILAHEINNSMQAVRGALTLANEEMDEPYALDEYLRVCRTECEQVIRLATRVRQFARSGSGQVEEQDLNLVLKETVALAGKEVSRQRIRLHSDLDSTPLVVRALPGSLHLIFFTAALDLGDALAEAGGNEMTLTSRLAEEKVQIEISGEAPGAMPATTGVRTFVLDLLFGLGGTLRTLATGCKLTLLIDLPAATEQPSRPET